MKNVLNKDKILGIVCLVISLFFGYNSTKIRGPLNPGDPGARLFPLIGCCILLLCGIAMLVRKSEADGKVFLTKNQWKRALMLFAVYIFVFASLWFLGFVITTFLTLLILCIMFIAGKSAEDKKAKMIIKSLIYAVILSVAIYLVYEVALNMQLPEGKLFELLK